MYFKNNMLLNYALWKLSGLPNPEYKKTKVKPSKVCFINLRNQCSGCNANMISAVGMRNCSPTQ